MAASLPPLLGSYLGVTEVSTTSGSGALALGGAVANSLPFSAKVADGATVTVKVDGGAQIEFLVAVYSYPSTVTPIDVISSTNGDQKIEWPATGQRLVSLEQDGGTGLLPPGGLECEALVKLSNADYDAGWRSIIPPGGECGQILVHNDSVECYPIEWQYRPYPIAAFISGAPDASQKVRLAVTEPLMFDEDFAGSWGYCAEDKTPTGPAYTILINRVRPPLLLGQLDFSEGYSQATWTSVDNAKQYLVPGDMIEFEFPADNDTIEDVSLTARAKIICQTMAIRFCGGTFSGDQVAGTECSSILQFALPTASASADTLFFAGWMGHATTEQGHNMILVYSNSSDHFIAVSIGDGSTIPEGSFALVLVFYDSTGTEVVSGFVEIPVDLTEGWHSFAISIRASTQTLQIMVDTDLYSPAGSDLFWFSTNPFRGFSALGFSGLWQFYGAFVSGNAIDTPPAFAVSSSGLVFEFNILSPDMSFYNFLMAIDDTFVDLSDAATVTNLFGNGAQVMNWGDRGELVTGNVPDVYFIGDYNTFHINHGLSGDIATDDWTLGGPGLIGPRVQNFLPLPP